MTRIYLPMSTRPDGYCVTDKEQKHYACKYGVDQGFVIAVCEAMAVDMPPQKTATKTKNLIHIMLKEAIRSASERVS